LKQGKNVYKEGVKHKNVKYTTLRFFIFNVFNGAPPHYVPNTAQEIRQNSGILNRVRLSWTFRVLKIAFQRF
jgi:hypothetical protein